MTCINVGCGQTPTPGWINFDNSPSLRLANRPLLVRLLTLLRVINTHQKGFIRFAAEHTIRWADATRKIPLPDKSVEVLYSSHMLEHLDRSEAAAFLAEARRVLQSDGVIRIAVPDLKRLIESYNQHLDADKFITETHLAVPKPKGMSSRAVAFYVGGRHHHWMYDARSLIRLLHESGFHAGVSLEPGKTTIADPGQLNLWEREEASIYVEAKRSN